MFGPPEGRPTARELLVQRMRRADPVPPGASSLAGLSEGRRHFWEARLRKHPGAVIPPEAAADTVPAPGPGPAAPPPGPAVPPPGPKPAVPSPDPGAGPVTPDDGHPRTLRERGFRWRRTGR